MIFGIWRIRIFGSCARVGQKPKTLQLWSWEKDGTVMLSTILRSNVLQMPLKRHFALDAEYPSPKFVCHVFLVTPVLSANFHRSSGTQLIHRCLFLLFTCKLWFFITSTLTFVTPSEFNTWNVINVPNSRFLPLRRSCESEIHRHSHPLIPRQ